MPGPDRASLVILSAAKNLCTIKPTAEEIYFSGRGPKNQISPAIATPTRTWLKHTFGHRTPITVL